MENVAGNLKSSEMIPIGLGRRDFLRSIAVMPLLAALHPVAAADQSGVNSRPTFYQSHPYAPVAGWPALPEGLVLGAVCGLALGKDCIFVLHRGNPPILCLDPDGHLVRSWGNDHIAIGHYIRCDTDGHVWVTDIEHHQVFKFTSEGQLIFALGKKDRPGVGPNQFNEPTDVAIASSGEFYVSDGYGNARIMKFNPAGELIHTWGRKGRNPGEFDTPHALCLDTNGKLYLSDRGNSRIQVFDGDGKFLEEWRDYPAIDGLAFGPQQSLGIACGPEICSDGLGLYAVTGRGNEILRLRSGGVVLESWGGPRSTESEVQGGYVPPIGRFNVAHGIAVDERGSLYIGEIRSRRVQKLVRQLT
ncbi:MAG: peptidyl-alpha-hydroxyglycine alpha-amidating lyase family protein [Terriglobales bacterium]